MAAPMACIDVLHEQGSLVAGGQAILTGLPADASPQVESGGLVLGFRSSKGPQSSHDVPLGQLSCERFLALAKSSLYWMSPMYGATASEVPRETQFLLLQLPGGTFALLLPLIDAGAFRATLRPPRAGIDGGENLMLRIESGADTVMADSWQGALYVCAGHDPFEVIERGVAAAARLSGGALPSREKAVPPSLDLFGWCTWDALYSRVSAAGIQEGLQSLAEGGVPPRFLIIDDGWQQTDVDPQYRDAAAQSLMSGMGHLPSTPERAAVEEAAVDILAGADMRQREELIGLHEMEEELRGPLALAAAQGRPLPPGGFMSLPATPRRYWGEPPGAGGGGGAGGVFTPRPGGPARGWATSPRPPLRPFPPGGGSVEASPRLSGPTSALPPGRPMALRGSVGSVGSMAESGPSQEGTPRMGATMSPALARSLFRNPFVAAGSSAASPLASPYRGGGGGGSAGSLQARGAGAVPQVPHDAGAPPPPPEVLAKQLQEAAAVTVHAGVPPVRTPSAKLAEAEVEAELRASGAAGAMAAVAKTGAAAVAESGAAEEGKGVGVEELVPQQQPRPGLWGRLLGLLRRGEVAVLRWVRSFLETAASDSWRMRLFSSLAQGPLRPSILRFYATATDHTRRLQSVKANSKFSHPEAGPEHTLSSAEGEEGLKEVVSHLKQQFGLRYVYCWHAMMGFWAGIAPEGPSTAKYQPRLVFPKPTHSQLEIDPSYSWVQPVLAGVGLADDPVPLHRDMHAFLKDCGVDGVKVDVQGTVGLTGSAAGGASALSATYHASLEASVREHFPGNHCINCMCGSSEDLYRMSHTNLARCSDDFYPHMPASWTAHIANCALNSLFCGELVVPDWDMFHSLHPAASLHAAARAICGGPVYVSDRPGAHDFDVLARLVLPDGSVLRCRRHARPTRDCLFRDVLRDGETVLKLWNLNGYGGVVGVFNIQGSAWSIAHRSFVMHNAAPPALAARVAPSDVAGLAPAAAYAVYRDATQELRLMGREEWASVEVAGGGGCDILAVSPVLEAAGVRVAPIGLPAMLNCGGAVLSCRPGEARAEVPSTEALKAAGNGARGSAGLEEGQGCVERRVGQREAQEGSEEQEGQGLPSQEGPSFELEVRGVGPFLCYASRRPSAVQVEGWEVPFEFSPATGALIFDLPSMGPMQKRAVLRFAAAAERGSSGSWAASAGACCGLPACVQAHDVH